MSISKFIIILLLTLLAVFTAIIYKLHQTDERDFCAISIQETVKEIYTIRGKPIRHTVRLNNELVIDVPEAFIPHMQTGDSVLKARNSVRIMLISFRQNSRKVIIYP